MAAAIILRTSTPVGVLVPEFEGQKVVDTTNDIIYISYGLTNADWQEVGAGGASAEYPASSTSITLDSGTPDATIDFNSGINNYHVETSTATTSLNFTDSGGNSFGKIGRIRVYFGLVFTTVTVIKGNGTTLTVLGTAPAGNESAILDVYISEGKIITRWSAPMSSSL